MRDKKVGKVELLLPDASWKPLGRALPHRCFLKGQNLLQKLPGTSPRSPGGPGALRSTAPDGASRASRARRRGWPEGASLLPADSASRA